MKWFNPTSILLRSIYFALSFFFLSLIKIRNLKTLSYRFLTVGLVFMHYYYVEKIPIENRIENESELFKFIVIWHIVFMNFKIAEESRRKKHDDLKTVIAIYIGVLAISTLLVLAFTPFLAYFNFKVTAL
jgi:hypothetical protein